MHGGDCPLYFGAPTLVAQKSCTRRWRQGHTTHLAEEIRLVCKEHAKGISGRVEEHIVAIDVARLSVSADEMQPSSTTVRIDVGKQESQ